MAVPIQYRRTREGVLLHVDRPATIAEVLFEERNVSSPWH